MSVALGDAAAKPVVRLATPAAEALPTPSPDGRWLAYQTSASGTAETRVAPLTDLTAFVQVSTRGGSPIRWNRDGPRCISRTETPLPLSTSARAGRC